jgi:hypothetical protein
MTNLRQLVESKGALQSVPKCGSDNPQKRFSKSTLALHRKHFQLALNGIDVRARITFLGKHVFSVIGIL